jgi:hypothetical protein
MADPVISREVMVSVDIVVDVDSSLPDGTYAEEAKHLVELKLSQAMFDYNEYSVANISNYYVTNSGPILNDEEWMAWVEAEYPEPVED